MASCLYVNYIQSTSMERGLSSAKLCIVQRLPKCAESKALYVQNPAICTEGTAIHASFSRFHVAFFMSQAIDTFEHA